MSARWVPVVKSIETRDGIRNKRKAVVSTEEACGEKGIHGLYNKPLRCYGYFLIFILYGNKINKGRFKGENP